MYVSCIHRAAERIGGGGGGQIQKVGPHKIECVRGSEGMPPGKFEILHALKCVLGAPEAIFHTCTQCKLPLLPPPPHQRHCAHKRNATEVTKIGLKPKIWLK